MVKITVGSVVQINENFPDPGWVGAFLVVTKITSEKVQGYLHIVRDRGNSGFAFVNCQLNEVEHIGRAKIICISDTRKN